MADQAQDLAIAEDLAHQLVRLITMTKTAKAQFSGLATEGIERAAYALLAHLVREGPKRITALADAVHSDTSTVSRQTSALVAHGLVERKADPEDGRACLLVATDAGRDTYSRAKAERTRHIAALMADWPQSDRRTLVMLLDRLNTDFENYHPVGESPMTPLVSTSGLRSGRVPPNCTSGERGASQPQVRDQTEPAVPNATKTMKSGEAEL